MFISRNEIFYDFEINLKRSKLNKIKEHIGSVYTKN